VSLVFKPVGILSGVLAGMVAKKMFEVLWGLIDDQEPPEAKHHDVQVGKLAAALALEGAIFRSLAASPTTARGGSSRSWPVDGPAKKRPRRSRRHCADLPATTRECTRRR
jgi:hypothetical protein